jgi:type IV secretory pathway VirB4 component
MQELIQASESENLNEKEFRSRIEVLEDRINIIDNLNSNEKIFASNFYIAIHDIDKRSLKNSLSIIATSLNANGIETKQLNNSELITFTKYTYTNDFDEREFNQLKDNEKIKSTFPNKVKFKTMRVLQDNKQLTHFVINDYPLKVTNAWAEELFDIPNTKVVLKAVPVDRYKAIRRIDNTINELLSQRDLGRASYQLDKSTHIESLQALLESLQNDNEVFFDTTIIITAYDDLKQTTTKRFVKRKLRELGFKFNEMFGRQIDAYLSNSISKTNNLKIDRGINSSSLSASFPFVSNAILDDNGIFIGENNLPTFIDFFKRNDERVNSNMVVIGKSGSGKSFATKTILSHLASNNSKVFILDPENEYGKLANSLNGKVLDVASSKDGRINPFHIITSLDDENMDGTNNSYFAHLQFLEEFFKLILQGINPDSLELLNKLILEMYNSKNINAKTDLSTLKPSNYPIFQDIAELIDSKLETEKDDYTKTSLKVLSNYLSKFRRGGRNSALWNGFTTFRPQENFVCFNFQKLLANKNNIIANAQMLLVLKWLDNEIIKNRDYNTLNKANRKIIVAIDEAHVFIDEKYPIALDFMYQLAKRIRKYNGMQIVITQNIKDFVGSPDIARKSSAIINVSQYSLIFSLSPNDISDLITLYEKAGQINDSESDNIVNLPRGCAFIITSPSSRTNVRIIASEKIQEMFE